MTDRELLEMAAKAAGIPVEWDGDGFVRPVPFKGFTNYEPWNPLTDDGDAFRLATNIDMSVEISDHEESTYAYAGSVPRVYAMENWREDKQKATRRAIVLAAAEIGKAMP